MKILAFPGMGKTPLAKKSGKYLDLDFGHYRQANGLKKSNEHRLLKSFSRLCDLYELDGFIVLSNEPALMQFTKFDRIYVPERISARHSKKLARNIETVQKWRDDWIEAGMFYNVPIVPLRVGLDHYLLSAGKLSTERRMTYEEAASISRSIREN